MNIMGIWRKRTTARQLQKVINEELVTIKSVKVQSKDDNMEKIITSDQFEDDLDFYLQSELFADSIDFEYSIQEGILTVYAGNMSAYCKVCITAELVIKDAVGKDDLEKFIRKVEE